MGEGNIYWRKKNSWLISDKGRAIKGFIEKKINPLLLRRSRSRESLFSILVNSLSSLTNAKWAGHCWLLTADAQNQSSWVTSTTFFFLLPSPALWNLILRKVSYYRNERYIKENIFIIFLFHLYNKVTGSVCSEGSQ